MRDMTASEASRRFSAVLDAVEGGESIVITRAGRRVASILPAPRANGAALRAVFERWHGDSALDDAFAEQVESVREVAAADLDSDSWRD